jgi:hypothetical protein
MALIGLPLLRRQEAHSCTDAVQKNRLDARVKIPTTPRDTTTATLRKCCPLRRKKRPLGNAACGCAAQAFASVAADFTRSNAYE